MSALVRLLAPLIALWLAAAIHPAAAEAEDLDPRVLARLELALAGPPGGAAEELQRLCYLAHGDLEPLFSVLKARSDDRATAPEPKRRIDWLRALLLRRHGELTRAQRVFEELVETRREPAALLELARVLDARGRREEAFELYEEVLPQLEDEELATAVDLRMAMLAMDRSQSAEGALAQFASERGRDPELRNRAAVVLALLGRHADAIELFSVGGEGNARFRQELRVAEWALRAGDAAVAQDYAWRAVETARLTRDRRYALTVLVEAHRGDDSLEALIERFAADPELHPDARGVWIDLLRETGRVDEALELFRASHGGEFSVELRRELLEMYREAEREETMVEVYRELIAAEPDTSIWREGLARFFLERGDRAAAEELWLEFLAGAPSTDTLLAGADSMRELDLDELAERAAERCLEADPQAFAAYLFRFSLELERGRLTEAEAQLERLAAAAPVDSPVRLQLGEAYEQLGNLERAVQVLEGVRAARGVERGGEDLDMHLAWLYSEVGDEERAMDLWLEIWRGIQSVPRRRYVEDRLMTVASRLGRLADIAIELEQKLAEGRADARESGLLVRLYSKVGDPVSASEVIEEFLEYAGGSEIDALQEKARVYLSCTDYYNYEKTVRELLEVDAEGRGDYLRQLAMSMLERGKPDQAREVLSDLQREEPDDSAGAEFEAGVLALSGLRQEAIRAYRKGIAQHPDRIESYLLLADLMKQVGAQERAVAMFQYLAEHADQDDLFTIAVDGLLNLEAPPRVLAWTRRVALERLAQRHDKMYLYQLISDLSEQLDDRDGMLIALESSLPISGERRPQILRELMDLSRAATDFFMGRSWQGEPDLHLRYGRRLIGLAELVPPQVYLDLGEAFLAAGDPVSAAKTFRLASDLPDYPLFQRQAAGLFEEAGFRNEALRTYERSLVSMSGDVSLMAKIGELQEQAGRDDVAAALYDRAIELLLVRQPLSTTVAAEELDPTDYRNWFRVRNVDDYDQYYQRLLTGFLVATPEERAGELLARGRASLDRELAQATGELETQGDGGLAHHPRLRRRAAFLRRVAFAYGHGELADELDLALLAAFPEDVELLGALVRERAAWGRVASARSLIEASGRPAAERRAAALSVGGIGADEGGDLLPVAEVARLVLPLLSAGRAREAEALIRRTDFGRIEERELSSLGVLHSAALFLDDPDLALMLGRQWLRLVIEKDQQGFGPEQILERCSLGLDEERKRGLFQYFASRLFEDPQQGSRHLRILPTLQKEFAEPIVSEEQVMALLEGYGNDGGWGFGVGPVLVLLPADKRAAALRAVWPKIQPTQRAYFLVQMVEEFEEPMGEGLTRFVRESFEEALGELDDSLPLYLNVLFDCTANAELVLELADMLERHEPESPIARALGAVMTHELGGGEQGVQRAAEIYAELLEDQSGEYTVRRARDQIEERFFPDHLEAFLEVIDAREGDEAEPERRIEARLQLLQQFGEPQAYRAGLAAALEELPEHRGLLDRQRRQLASEGRRWEALVVLERLLATEPTDPIARAELVQAWLGFENPVRALAVRDEGDFMEGGEAGPSGTELDMLSAGMVLPPGAVVIGTGGGTIRIASMDGEEGDRPTIGKVKRALDGGDAELARLTFRRLWREYPVGEQSGSYGVVRYYGWDRFGQMSWPPDEAAGDEPEEEPPPRRGGLEEFSEEQPPEPEPRQLAVDVLAEHEFGAAELRRALRAKDAREMDAFPSLIEALLRARLAQADRDAVLAELLAEVLGGRAGKLEYALLLTLLDGYPALDLPAIGGVLGDLAQTLNPADTGQWRRLARVHARRGAGDQATRLYRWCAAHAGVPSDDFTGFRSGVDSRELVGEVVENLEGEGQLAVVETVLRLADPGDDTWQRESYEVLSLDTWNELLGPAEALSRCRGICTEVLDLDQGLRRNTAKWAAYLWAHAGEVERAVACLELALCELDVIFPEQLRWMGRPDVPGYLSHADLRRLFPRDLEGWQAPLEWLRASSAALMRWHGEGRGRADQQAQALCLIARRLHALGEREQALELVAFLGAQDELRPATLLWVVDAAREVGDESLADGLELRLLAERRLRLERVVEVVERTRAERGPAAALELGEAQAEYTLRPALLELLVRAAEEVGEPERAQLWRDTLAEAERAGAALEAAESEGDASAQLGVGGGP